MGPVGRAQWAVWEGRGVGGGRVWERCPLVTTGRGGIWLSQEHQENLRGLDAKDRET